MDSAFARVGQIWPFIHDICSLGFVGILLGVLIFARYFLQDKRYDATRYALIIKEYPKFEVTLFILLVLTAVSGYFCANTNESIFLYDPMVEAILATKWAIMLFIVINFTYMRYKFIQAKRAHQNGDFITAHENLIITIYYFTTLNLVVCIIGIYLGITFEDFK